MKLQTHREETVEFLGKMRDGNPPDDDGIPTEILNKPEDGVTWMHGLFNVALGGDTYHIQEGDKTMPEL